MSARWAVLIGVGLTYVRNTASPQGPLKDRSLEGAVNDINSISEYLKSRTPDAHITALTATKSTVKDRKHAEELNQLATWDNVISAFLNIINSASPGDNIYIHYSGHGSHRQDGAVILELIDPATLEPHYLYGNILRDAIRKMIEKGSKVLLVLDCCFSGSVLRHGRPDNGAIRYLEHDTFYDAQSDLCNPFDELGHDSLRDGVVTLSRLLNPQGYAIISACGPHEVASELTFEAGNSRGALSYFLINSLTLLSRRGGQVSTQTLHQHLRAQFHARHPGQTPMLYGLHDLSFFGNFSKEGISNDPSTVSMHRDSGNGTLILHAGQAHGVQKDDEYALTSFESPARTNTKASIKAKVQTVDCLTSQLILLEAMHEDLIRKGSTWEATLLTSLSREKIRISISDEKNLSDSLYQMASCTNYLDIFDTARTSSEAGLISYLVKRLDNHFEVCDLALAVVAKVPANTQANTELLFEVLNHIAKYKFFEGLENKLSRPLLENMFSLQTTNIPGPDGYLCVNHGETLMLNFENLSNQTLYLGLFLFTELWEVRNLLGDEGEDGYLPVPPKGYGEEWKPELPIRMTVPDTIIENGCEQTEDIIKIFITSRPFVFPGIVLPKLQHSSIYRSRADSLGSFLEELDGGHDSVRDEKCEWTTRTFLVRVHI